VRGAISTIGVQFTGFHAPREVGRQPGKQAHIEPSMLAFDVPQSVRKITHQRRHQRTHHRGARQVIGSIRHGQRFVAAHDVFDIRQQAPAMRIEHGSPRGAVEQLAIEVGFKRADLQSDGGRGQPDFVPRCHEGAVARHGQENAQRADGRHGSTPVVIVIGLFLCLGFKITRFFLMLQSSTMTALSANERGRIHGSAEGIHLAR
jgi:hypothetical protein